MIKAVMFDMDNTLLETQVLYEEAHVELAKLIARFVPEATEKEVVTVLRNFETQLFDTMGYGALMLPQAFENTVLKYVPNASDALVDEARDMAFNVYAREAALKPGAEEAVKELSGKYRLFIVTAGDDEVQQGRIAKLAFAHLFEEIYIVPHKDKAVFDSILAAKGIKPEEAVMIGDSLRSDIYPALEAGMKAIHINSINWAGREMAGLQLPADKVTSHQNLATAVAEITGAAPAAKAAGNDNQPAAPAVRQDRKPRPPSK